jgi:hypothetical protein
MPNSTAGEADSNLYAPYVPSKVAAYAYLALFAIGGLIHFILMFPMRAVFFIPLIIGCISKCLVLLGQEPYSKFSTTVEAGGYYFRSSSSDNPRKILPFVLQGLLILAAPPFLAATIYMTLGRIIRNLKAEACSLIAPRWLTKLFVLGDIVCFVSQILGSIMRASDDLETNQRGSHIVLAGLIVQVGIFCFFVLLTANFQARFSRQNYDTEISWRIHIWVLYILSVIFLVRNIVRIVEFLQGGHGFIVTHESMLYIFDGSFMFFVVLLFVFFHPGRLFRAARRVNKMNKWGVDNEMAPLAS